jgi:hypothetical protein
MAPVPPALGAHLLHFGWPALVAVVAMSTMVELPIPLLHGALHSDLLPLGSPIRAPKQRLSLPLSVPSDKQQGLPLLHSVAALQFVLHSPRRVSSLSCSLRSPIHDAIKTHGEKPPAVLDVYFPMCVMFDELPPTNLCVFVASGRRRASHFARSTKCRAMWTAHMSSLIPFRLIDL